MRWGDEKQKRAGRGDKFYIFITVGFEPCEHVICFLKWRKKSFRLRGGFWATPCSSLYPPQLGWSGKDLEPGGLPQVSLWHIPCSGSALWHFCPSAWWVTAQAPPPLARLLARLQQFLWGYSFGSGLPWPCGNTPFPDRVARARLMGTALQK